MKEFSFPEVILIILGWWMISFIFLRLTHRHADGHTWQKDILLAFIQAIMAFIFISIIDFFL